MPEHVSSRSPMTSMFKTNRYILSSSSSAPFNSQWLTPLYTPPSIFTGYLKSRVNETELNGFSFLSRHYFPSTIYFWGNESNIDLDPQARNIIPVILSSFSLSHFLSVYFPISLFSLISNAPVSVESLPKVSATSIFFKPLLLLSSSRPPDSTLN